jgi:hypothetical protein
MPLSRKQMLALKGIFPGKVDIIHDIGTGDWRKMPAPDSMRNDVLSLLTRRPCTSADVARSLGLHISEALKHIDALVSAGKVETVQLSEKTYYATKGSLYALRS